MNTDLWLYVAAAIVALDVYLATSHHRTLSQQARDAAKTHPWLPWVVIGLTVVLFGHFWLGWLWN